MIIIRGKCLFCLCRVSLFLHISLVHGPGPKFGWDRLGGCDSGDSRKGTRRVNLVLRVE